MQIHYGIFLDHFTTNLLLDHFITEKQYTGMSFTVIHCLIFATVAGYAEKVFDHLIDSQWSLVICIKYKTAKIFRLSDMNL